MIAAAKSCHSSLELENLKSLSAKMMTLFESQFVGGDEDKPAKLFEFLDQMKSEVISSNNINTESIDTLTSLIKQKDGDIAALTKNLKEFEEKHN
jgi:hypothetical protein